MLQLIDVSYRFVMPEMAEIFEDKLWNVYENIANVQPDFFNSNPIPELTIEAFYEDDDLTTFLNRICCLYITGDLYTLDILSDHDEIEDLEQQVYNLDLEEDISKALHSMNLFYSRHEKFEIVPGSYFYKEVLHHIPVVQVW